MSASTSTLSSSTGISGGSTHVATNQSNSIHQGISNVTTPIIAPIIELPEAFGTVAPGIYRCNASSLTKGLPSQSQNSNGGRKEEPHQQRSTLSNSTQNHNGPTSSSFGPTSMTTPIDSFLCSLKLKTILLLAHEKKPMPLISWCSNNQVELIHLGLGALAEKAVESSSRSDPSSSSLSHNKVIKSGENLSDTGILSMERIIKDSLEIILDKTRLPCLICDTSGVKETGVVVACLRRMQRRSFASIRYEYRAFAGSRARSSHERFIEIFDPDLISLPHKTRLPDWFAQQQKDDEEEEDERAMSTTQD